jgi:hypothetical protein
VRLYFGNSPEDGDEIDAQVRDFEGACCIIGMAVLVAAAGPDGFDEEELDAVMIGATPAEVTKMVLHGLASLVEKAWPNNRWSE